MSGGLEQTTEKAQGVEQAAEPCWYAETPEGHAWEYGDGSPHWESESKALDQLSQMLQADRGQLADLTLRQESAPCWHLACAECGYRFDEDEWLMHFPGQRDALQTAEDCDWHIVDGRVLCPECAFPPGESA